MSVHLIPLVMSAVRSLAILLAPVALLTLAACGSAPSGPVVEEGALEIGDLTLGTGEYNDSYSVRVSEGQWLSIRVAANGFDPYLLLMSPSGQQSDLDDSSQGDTTSVETVVRADESGTWDVNVTSYEVGGTGSYRLTYEVTDVQPSGAQPAGSDAATADV